MRQHSCSAGVIWCIGTRQAMAGVTAQRTAIMVIVNAPALFTLISLLLLFRIEHLLVLDQAQ
ncbi:MAG: hypothetical protein DMG83_07430 [Acidobacteria bacterium]|nr:MAG: hypothetical protein DMG83_07430 [Acidobacteriota bacterium]